MLETFLRNYVKEYCGESAEVEYDSTCGSILSFGDESLSVIVEPHESEAWLSCPLRDIPVKNREKFYESLLVSQLFCQLTRGAHFSLNLNKGKVLLCKNFSLENLDQKDFNEKLNQFWEACLSWLSILDKLNLDL